jgi:hypothetical protein
LRIVLKRVGHEAREAGNSKDGMAVMTVHAALTATI